MTADPLSEVFSALSDPTRRDIVARLAGGDATVSELAAPYDISKQAVSRHLRVLRDAGLVSRGSSRTSPVHLEAQVLSLMTKWLERYRRRAEQRYQRLDAVLAELEGRGMSQSTGMPDHNDHTEPDDHNDSYDRNDSGAIA